MKIKIIKKTTNSLPCYAKKGDAGMDLKSNESLIIKSMERKIISTGIFFEIPENYEGHIRPRSSMFIKGLFCDGTIDSGYRGEIKIICINLSNSDIEILKGDRIAQIIFSPIATMELIEVSELSESERNNNGFGHTGI